MTEKLPSDSACINSLRKKNIATSTRFENGRIMPHEPCPVVGCHKFTYLDIITGENYQAGQCYFDLIKASTIKDRLHRGKN